MHKSRVRKGKRGLQEEITLNILSIIQIETHSLALCLIQVALLLKLSRIHDEERKYFHLPSTTVIVPAEVCYHHFRAFHCDSTIITFRGFLEKD